MAINGYNLSTKPYLRISGSNVETVVEIQLSEGSRYSTNSRSFPGDRTNESEDVLIQALRLCRLRISLNRLSNRLRTTGANKIDFLRLQIKSIKSYVSWLKIPLWVRKSPTEQHTRNLLNSSRLLRMTRVILQAICL